ncbi:hypothetical protein COU18_00325 [Candidatus Kaiserbacteria bacterium CG10_big_fil_rev_8_21_14_0_10_51_14]|uniref:Uncharacterized protein n=1 Tax=Candidatus Kaiserbacteria bacterium CG10_big_fil_rev_8_21_14_0_10_51_14 TaxID=1974610 RepID=A0A2H0UCR6_9BACT|nr:MAG: hypothetical protein COU18_00325 [Candidatus Kaiserbacteria bacterium CG10_big_fil_rev_8_21_14_0_10_51_14]
MENKRSYESGFSGIGITAALSVVVLFSALGWQIKETVQQKSAATSYVAALTENDRNTTDEVWGASDENDMLLPGESALGVAILDEVVGRYVELHDQGVYTEEVGQSVATKMAETLVPAVPYRTYTSGDIKTDSDTSANSLKRYGDALRASLAPLRKNEQPEFEIFAYYIDTEDEKYLAQLKEIAGDYRAAANATAKIVVPADAVSEHVAILNAMEEFAATLDALAANATDPYASTALLRTYNQAESDMYLSFQALAGYYKQKNS